MIRRGYQVDILDAGRAVFRVEVPLYTCNGRASTLYVVKSAVCKWAITFIIGFASNNSCCTGDCRRIQKIRRLDE